MAGEAPYTTGSDILSYQGNANLAVGSGAAAPNGLNFQPLSGVIGKMQDQEADVQMMKYKEKLAKQEKLAKLLSGQDGSVFNMKDPQTGKDVSFAPLPDDQKILTQKAHDLRKIILSKPESYQYDQKYLDAYDEFNNLKKQASIRSVHVSNEQADMGKYDNEEDRADAQQHLNDEVFKKSLTDYHRPEPYLPHLKYDPNRIYGSEKDLYETSENLTQDPKTGLWYKETASKPNIEKLDIRKKIANSSEGKRELANTVTAFIKSDFSRDPQWIAKHNQDVEQANQKLGLQPGDAHYIPTIPTDQMGVMSPQWAQDRGSANDLYYSLTAPSFANTTVKRVASDEALDQKLKQGKVEQLEPEAEKTVAETELIRAKIKEMQEAEKEGKTLTDSQRKMKADQKTVQSVRNDVQAIFNTPLKKISLKPFSDVYDEGVELPKSKANRFIGIEAGESSTVLDDKKKGKTTTKTAKGQSEEADNIYLAKNKKTGKKEVIFIKNGEIVASVSEKDAVINGLKHDAKYTPAQYENKLPYVEEMFSEDESPAQKTKAASQQATPVTRKELNGVTYEQDASGKWFKI